MEHWKGTLEVTCPTLLLKQGHLQQIAHSHIQVVFESLQGWRFKEGIPVLRSRRNIALCLPGQKGRVHPRMVGMAITFPPKPPDLKCWHGCAFGHLELLHIPTTLAASSGRCLGAPQPTEAKSTVSRAGHSSEDTSQQHLSPPAHCAVKSGFTATSRARSQSPAEQGREHKSLTSLRGILFAGEDNIAQTDKTTKGI